MPNKNYLGQPHYLGPLSTVDRFPFALYMDECIVKVGWGDTITAPS